MSEIALLTTDEIVETEKSYIELYGDLEISQIETENDDPVDNLFSAKQQRLLVESLYTSWQQDRPYLADANVGLFESVHLPPLVPDFFLSLDVQANQNWWAKENRSYFIWEFGKPPELVIEIVSNRKGNETTRKLRRYAQMGIWYYIVYDPQRIIQNQALVIYENQKGRYIQTNHPYLEQLGFSIGVWSGEYEQAQGEWLRWYDVDGQLIATGAERSAHAMAVAKQEKQRAEEQELLAKQEKQRAEEAELQLMRLQALLREKGIDF